MAWVVDPGREALHLHLEMIYSCICKEGDMSTGTREMAFDAETSASAAELLDRTTRSDADWVIRKSDLAPRVAELIEAVLETVAGGDGITVGRVPEEVTTTTAASMLGISRPTLMKHVRAGHVPSHAVGTHTRLRRDDVFDFKRSLRKDRARAIQELMELEDELEEPL